MMRDGMMMRSVTVHGKLVALVCCMLVACADDDTASTDSGGSADATDAGNDASDAGVDDVHHDAASDAGTDAPPTLDSAQLFEFGQYPVGYVRTDLAYDPPGDAVERSIPLHVWYPAAEEASAELVTYTIASVISVDSDVAMDAPHADPAAHPLVIYSHGSGGDGRVGTRYAEHFASRGWIVVAPSHTGDTITDTRSDTAPPPSAKAVYRVTDIVQTLDAVEAGLDADVELVADLERVFLFGHSFGGYTALAVAGGDLDYAGVQAACDEFGEENCAFLEEDGVAELIRQGFGDARIDAIAAQAPVLVTSFDEPSLTALGLPLMLHSGALDTVAPHEESASPAWQATARTDDIWIDLPAGGHLSFHNICFDVDPGLRTALLPNSDNQGCGPEFIDAELAVSVLRAYLIAFAELHVLGEEGWRDVVYGPSLEEGFVVEVGQ